MNSTTKKWLRVLVLMVLFLIARIPKWIVEHNQFEFGQNYSAELLKLHDELSVEDVDLSADRSYAIFSASSNSHTNVKAKDYVDVLALDIKKVYCHLMSVSKDDLEIEYFHVSVRVDSDDALGNTFSRELSKNSCA